MSIISLTDDQKNTFHQFLFHHDVVQKLINDLHAQNAQVYAVGGAVRDLLLNRTLLDVDIEVHGLTLEELKEVLSMYGHVELVGKSFGVLKLFGVPIDWALPRTDTSGRKPTVTLDPFMPLTEALRRRDVTMNAMALDLKTLIIHDPFGGYQDLQDHVLRAVDPTFFSEDPLRFYRVMQFIGRFALQPDKALDTLCMKMDISTVSRERIEKEFEKLLLLSQQPSLGFRWLNTIKRLREILPELAATEQVKQNPEWHPEGDVFEHTMQAVDAAAALDIPSEHRLMIVYAALCHDLGKTHTTKIVNGKITSYRHEIVGVDDTKSLLKRITHNVNLIHNVALLVRYHMAPGLFARQKAGLAAYKRLANNIAPLTLEMLAWLSYADRRGRNGHRKTPLADDIPEIDLFIKKAQEADVLFHKEKPVLVGADLLDVVPAGPRLGELLKEAYNIQLNENIKDKAELKKRVLQIKNL